MNIYTGKACKVSEGISVGFDDAGNSVFMSHDPSKKPDQQEILLAVQMARENLSAELAFLTTWMHTASQKEQPTIIIPQSKIQVVR